MLLSHGMAPEESGSEEVRLLFKSQLPHSETASRRRLPAHLLYNSGPFLFLHSIAKKISKSTLEMSKTPQEVKDRAGVLLVEERVVMLIPEGSYHTVCLFQDNREDASLTLARTRSGDTSSMTLGIRLGNGMAQT